MCNICNDIYDIYCYLCNNIKECIRYIYNENLYMYSYMDEYDEYENGEDENRNYYKICEEDIKSEDENRNYYKICEEDIKSDKKDENEIELKSFSNDRFNKDNIIIILDEYKNNIRLRKNYKEREDDDGFIIIDLPIYSHSTEKNVGSKLNI